MLSIVLALTLVFLSLTSTIFKYYNTSTPPKFLALATYFTGVWSLGAVGATIGAVEVSLLSDIAFYYAPSLTGYFIVEYILEITGNLTDTRSWHRKFLLAAQLIVTTTFLVQDQEISGTRYFIYCLYYIFIFVRKIRPDDTVTLYIVISVIGCSSLMFLTLGSIV